MTFRPLTNYSQQSDGVVDSEVALGILYLVSIAEATGGVVLLLEQLDVYTGTARWNFVHFWPSASIRF